MPSLLDKYPFFCRMSFGPLIKAIRASVARAGQEGACRSMEIDSFLEAAEALPDPVPDAELTEEHKRLAAELLRLAFSPTAMESEAVAAFSPFSRRPVFATDAFRRLFIAEDGTLQGQMSRTDEGFDRGLAIRAYLFILDRFYGIRQQVQYPLVRIVEDPETGLERHYRIDPDYRFVEALAVDEASLLGETEKEWVLDHLTDPEALREVLPPERFGLQGLTVFKAADTTEAEMVSALSRDLIDQESIVSMEGFDRLQHHLRVLFQRPELTAGIAALEQNQILLLNSGTDKSGDCIFAGSRHASVSLFSGSPFERAVDSGHIVRVADVEKDAWFQKEPGKAAPEGIRSLMIAPLSYKGRVIGTLDVGSPKAGDLCPMDTVLMSQIQPLFAMAVNKALDDFHGQIQRIIKEKCTPIHPVVEWRFEQEALAHLEALRTDENAQMAPIVFKDVFPIYGISDVRGSAAERNRAISEDLSAQLALALKIVKEAGTVRPLMIFRELEKRIQGHMKRLKAGLDSDDEATVLIFLRSEVEAHFPELKTYGPKTARAVDHYMEALDPAVGTLYRVRKDLEESLFQLTEKMAAYLDREEAELQRLVPHYFERHRTDGVDYLIYAGESLLERGGFCDLHLKNLHLWQLKTAAGLARLAEAVGPELKVPLKTAHLVLVQEAPLSIRFRYDERRFDVDGAYDVRNEIIKSRIDKARVKATGERLTQPGKIAVVYTSTAEAREMRQHIEFLIEEKELTGRPEFLDLEDLPGVQGLKALRVEVDMQNAAQAAPDVAGKAR
ncbi:MAG: GAF domain-containing protein [Desulfobacterales bacterium]|nr:GAF domain-containing protein [Desulfobacterales bacterium]